MNKILIALIKILGILNPVLSWGGLSVALIWLIILGQWWVIVGGLVVIMVDTYLYSFTIFPIQLIIGGIAIILGKIYKPALYFTVFIGALLNNAFIVFWSLLFITLASYLSKLLSIPIWPLFIAGYSVATVLFVYMAQKEDPNNIPATLAVILSQISYLVLFLLFLVIPIELVVICAVVFVIIWTIFNLKLIKNEQKEIAFVRGEK